MWRSATFPAPGFVMYMPANILPIGDQDPDDRWNPSFTLLGTTGGSETFPPDSFAPFRGVFVSGDLNSLLADDGDKLCYNPGITLNPLEAPVTIDLFGTSPDDAPASIEITIESSANTVGLGLTFKMRDYPAGVPIVFDIVGTASQTNGVDTIRTFSGDPAQHVEAGTGAVHVRYEVRKTGFTFLFPWTDCIDHVFWTVGS
jgi:hypothetical protein